MLKQIFLKKAIRSALRQKHLTEAPGFEAIVALAGIVAVAYVVAWKRLNGTSMK